MRLGEILLRTGRLKEADVLLSLNDARRSADRRLGEVLLTRGLITELDLAEALAQQSSLEIVDLETIEPQASAIALLPEADARVYGALPLALNETGVIVATTGIDKVVHAKLENIIGQPVVFRIATVSALRQAIDGAYSAVAGIEDKLRKFEAQDGLRREHSRSDVALASQDAPVVQVAQMIITQGLRDRASDVHIEPNGERIRVRYRIDGALHDTLDLPGSIGPALVSRVKVLAGMNIVERRRAQDGQISMVIDDRPVDIRVATSAVVGGEKVVLRLLDKSRSALTLEQLGMPDATAKNYVSLLRAPYGMVICAGPTGSGKTTTLYGSLGKVNSADRNVMTIEDPVEYVFPSINQIQINEAAGITFAGGLRSILRQDPDIILVGEMRDVETARIAVQSALTGHFVLSSLHSTDAASALHRLIDMGIESFLVVSSVSAVVAQRLVRRVCGRCKAPYTPSTEETAFLRATGVPRGRAEFVRGAGCNFCAQTGYRDRIGVYELLPMTTAIRDLVIDHATAEEVREVARKEGMSTLLEEGVRLAVSGVTDIAEIMRSVYVAGA